MNSMRNWQGANLESSWQTPSEPFLHIVPSPFCLLKVFSAAADIAENGSTDHQMG